MLEHYKVLIVNFINRQYACGKMSVEIEIDFFNLTFDKKKKKTTGKRI